MKKIILILAILIVFLSTTSPSVSDCVVIFYPKKIMKIATPHDWLHAIVWVESTDGVYIHNPNEPAVGKLQIWPIVVYDVNRIVGYEKYTLDDRLNSRKSEEMFWIYQTYYNPKMDLEKMARIWCGGPDGAEQSCTLPYLDLVKNRLKEVKLSPTKLVT